MRTLKKSLMTLTGLLMLIGIIAVATPFKGYSQQSAEAITEVKVVNPASAPVLTTDAPIQLIQREVILSFSSSLGVITDQLLYTVPAGKKLIIENASVLGEIQQNQRLVLVSMSTTINSITIEHPLPIQQRDNYAAAGQAFALANIPLRLYATAGTAIKVSAIRDTTGLSASVRVAFSGYLVNTSN